MKQTLLAVAVAALVATGFSFAASRWLTRGHTPPSMHETQSLTHRLGLSAEQASAIAALEQKFRSELEACCARHCAARVELSRSLDDPAQANRWVETMCAANTAAEHATLAHILQVRALLTPAQQAQYAALINDQLCAGCPMGKHASTP